MRSERERLVCEELLCPERPNGDTRECQTDAGAGVGSSLGWDQRRQPPQLRCHPAERETTSAMLFLT